MSIVTNATANLNMAGFSVTGINGFSSTFANVNTATITNLSTLGSLALTFGSNSLPAYAFVGNTGTGMWSPGTNQLGFSTGGVQRLNIDSVGNVSATLFVGNLSSAEYINYPTATISTNVITSFIQTGNRYAPWGTRIGGQAVEQGNNIAVNNLGDIACVGQYNSSFLVVYNIGGNITAFTLPNSGRNDAFIVKYNSIGTPQWGTRISSTDEDYAYSVAENNSGNIVVIGNYRSSPVVIYNAGGTIPAFTLTPNGTRNSIFIAKYASAGSAIWANKLTCNGLNTGECIDLNNNEDIVVAGNYSATLNLYNLDNIPVFTLPYSGIQSAFIAKYNSSGIPQWINRIAGTSLIYATDIALNNNSDIVITGYYDSSPINIYYVGGITIAFTIPNSGAQDCYIVRYDSSGNPSWGARIGSTNNDYGYGIDINDSADIVVTGTYQNTIVTIYNSTRTTAFTLANSGSGDAFVVKYLSGGQASWGARIANTNSEYGTEIAINNNGDIAVIGDYVTFPARVYNAGGTFESFSLPNSGITDIFMIKYSNSGIASWGATIAGPSIEFSYGIAINDIGDIVTTGYYFNTLVIYNSGGIITAFTLANSGNDAFIVKYIDEITLILPNPLINGQEKVITSLGPKTIINPITVNGTSTSLTIYSGDTLNLLWDATNSNWVNRDNVSQISGGSAPLPSYSFLGDTNTGMFSPGADNIAFSTGGIQRLQIDGIGNITSSNINLNVNSGNILLGTGSNDWTSSSSYYIGRNQSANFGANSGFSGIEFGGPASANEGYLAFHTFDYPSTSGEMMRINKTGVVSANVFSNYNSCAVIGLATSIPTGVVSMTAVNLSITFNPKSAFSLPSTTQLKYTGTSGFFWVQVSGRLTDAVGTQRGIGIFKNGNSVSENWSMNDSYTTGRWGSAVCCGVTLNGTTDYLEFRYAQDSGGAIAIINLFGFVYRIY